jgi:hypothetical protein
MEQEYRALGAPVELQRQQKSHPSAAKLPNLRHIYKLGI